MMSIGFGRLGIFGRRRNQVTSFAGAYDAIPSIVAAYGMRRLRGAYTGSLLRIRRSSDNTEQDIGYTSTGDLDTAAIATFIGGGSGYIVNWYDQSGNGYTAAQTTAANQPLYVASGQNGRAVARFDGTNDLLSTLLAVSASFSLLVAGKSNDTSTNLFHDSFIGWRYVSAPTDQHFSLGRYGAGRYDSGNKNVAYDAGTGWTLWTHVETSGATLYTNGVERGTAAAVTWVSNNLFTISGSNPGNLAQTQLNGDIAEIIICNAALSDANRGAAETAMNSYWAVY